MDQVGKGHFSTVYKAKHKRTGEVFALKIIKKEDLNDREMRFIRDEIQIFTLVSHPNVARMREVFETEKEIQIIMDLANGGDLFEFIINRDSIPKVQVLKILYNLLEVLDYL